jgi:hypothetical protein
MSTENNSHAPIRRKIGIISGIFVLLFIIIFAHYLSSAHVLMTTDAAISDANVSAQSILETSLANWYDGTLLGMPREASTRLPRLLKAVLPGVLWNNWVYGFALLLSSLALTVLLFRKKLSLFAVVLAGLTAFWVGSNFTLIYAGHTLKPYVILFYLCALLVARIPSWRGGILWGASVGLAFMQQPDVAMFFALFAGMHLLFTVWRREGFRPVRWIPVLLPALAVALLFASGPLLSGYQNHVKNTAQVQTESPQQKWDYITQWSFPPEEMSAFIAPGYTGWRSGESEGPYWGRMGRSAGWEQTRHGFMNFKLENTYLGIIPIVFAFFALFACRRSKHRAEIIFWSAATLVALLLSFGKFTPLYRLFYHLPIVNNVRNPNKFLQVFQIGLGILTAYGADALFRSDNPRAVRRFFWGLVGAAGVLTFWALGRSVGRADIVTSFVAQGWPREQAAVIAANQVTSLWYAVGMALISAAPFAIFSFPRFGKVVQHKNWIAAALILIVAADAVKLSKHYVKEMPRSYISANPLTGFLQEHLGPGRVALLTQDGIYNVWLSYLLPYHQISTFNFSQMPRMPEDYQTFLTAGSKNSLAMWRFSAVNYLLGPATVEQQLAGQVKKVFAYDLAPAVNDAFRVVANPNGTHVVFELLNTSSRYQLIAPEDLRTLDNLFASRAAVGSVEIIDRNASRIELKTESAKPSVLRVAERWDPDWKAKVDGVPTDVQRVDFLCQGVAVPAGEHRVELRYAPPRYFFYMQCGGYLLLLVALVSKPWKKDDNA